MGRRGGTRDEREAGTVAEWYMRRRYSQTNSLPEVSNAQPDDDLPSTRFDAPNRLDRLLSSSPLISWPMLARYMAYLAEDKYPEDRGRPCVVGRGRHIRQELESVNMFENGRPGRPCRPVSMARRPTPWPRLPCSRSRAIGKRLRGSLAHPSHPAQARTAAALGRDLLEVVEGRKRRAFSK